jgi:membrane-associated phospholipid phosphatase
LTYTQFFLAYSSSIILAICLGLWFMVGPIGSFFRRSISFVRRYYVFLIILAALPLAVQAVSLAKSHLAGADYASDSTENAGAVYALGGGVIKVLQKSLDSDLLGASFEVTYMWVFAFFTYFLPVLLIAKRDIRTLSAFTIAIAINYSVLISSYVLFPVRVSSSLPGANIQPVLYDSHTWGMMATSVDSLTNCFPSGHISLSFTALFVFSLAGPEYRRLSCLLAATGITLVFAVLYLGIHYPADVIGGLVLAIASAVCATNKRVRETALSFVRSVYRAEVDTDGTA